MAKVKLRDMIVVLPGITGSVLRKNNKDLWAVTGQSIWKTLVSKGDWLQELRLAGDDIDDGVEATRILADIHIVPGLKKVDGYSGLNNFIRGTFDVVEGSHLDAAPANFVEFPYDWRRDNRIAARQLETMIETKLTAWRAATNNDDAKAILIGHSMGGLVSRYYLEVLEGWPNCRALITFGTPYRGSFNSLDFLAHGYKKLFLDLTEVMRSFTSVYQLLPIYAGLHADGDWRRIAEVEGIPGVEAKRAADALAFHREIETAVADHSGDDDYRKFKVLPFVGTRQKTLQSATFDGNGVRTSHRVPDWIDSLLEEGDGTVPRLSAIPIELSDEWRDTFVPEHHASLQNNKGILEDIRGRITQMQVQNLGAIRGPELTPELETRPAMALEVDDLYLADEPVVLRASVVNPVRESDVVANVTPVNPSGPPQQYTMIADGDSFVADASELGEGTFRVSVATTNRGADAPAPVTDVFEVVR